MQQLMDELRSQRERHEQFAHEIRSAINGMAKSITEYTTVLRRHIAEEERIGQRIDRLIEDHERRIRDLEEWQTHTAATLPAWVADARDLKSDLDGVRMQVAKWAGGLAVVLLVIQLTVVPAIQEKVKRWMGADEPIQAATQTDRN